MKIRDWVFLFLALSSLTNAALTLHLQAPFRSTAGQEDFVYHVLGSAGGGYNPMYGETSTTIMASEGNGWFVYRWDKDISEFPDWSNFNIAATPNTADQNLNNNGKVAWKEFGEKKPVEIFGSDTEVWIYTSDADFSFEKSFVAPGSKTVWFKSPWGNKALPQMVFGGDTVMMRFAQDDKTKCGWFYGAVTPTMLAKNSSHEASFSRYMTPYMSAGSVDLKSALAANDEIFVDGTSSNLSPSNKIGSLGECFDSTRTLHVYHPWRANTTYKDSALFMSVGNNIMNNPTRMQVDDYPRWWKVDFDNKTVNSSNWTSTGQYGAKVNFYRKQSEWPEVKFFANHDSVDLRPGISEWFPKGVYETWIYTKDNGAVDVIYSPLEPKYVRAKSPWDNMSPMLILPNDTIKMGPFSADTCGWYQGIVYKHTENWSAYFRQAFGMVYADARGVRESSKELVPFDFNDVMKNKDTVYIMPSPTLTSPLKAFEEFPNSFGACPELVLNVRIVDWAGEGILKPGATSSQESDFSIDVDFGGIYAGNEYTKVTYIDSNGVEKKNQKCDGHVPGMVNDMLYTDTILMKNPDKPSGYDTLFYKIPTRVDSALYPWDKCSAAREIERWFIPDTVKTGSGDYIAATCYQIPMTLDEEGFWLVDISEDSPNEGFFPLDDFKYLDSNKTVWNPKYDSTCIEGHCHNYSFAMKIAAQFQYVKGQYFEFRGDDDVWVFINDRLVVDIGGCHSPVEGGVLLDTIGQDSSQYKLQEGSTYSFYIFFSERNATGSNFKMRTSINLQTEKTYYWEEHVDENGVSSIELLQRMVDRNQSCDEGSVAQAKVQHASSLFYLIYTDGHIDTLEAGKSYYGGIFIGENGSSFKLDTTAISAAHESGDGLPAGNYTLKFCKEDGSECDSYAFVITVPQPTIAFADSLGNVINPDSTILGEFAGVYYPVYVKVLYRGNDCYSDMCLGDLTLSSLDSLLEFYDLSMKPINRVTLVQTEIDGKFKGMAKFFVFGRNPIEKPNFASFKVMGADEKIANEIEWTNITLSKAPVPPLDFAEMHDNNGDGIGDSLYIRYQDLIKDDERYVLDSLTWVFGVDSSNTIRSKEAILSARDGEKSLMFKADSLYKTVFTGNTNGTVYAGTLNSHWRFFKKNDSTGVVDTIAMTMGNQPIQDFVPPVILKAVVDPRSEHHSVLDIYLSESLDSATKINPDLLDFKIYFDGQDVSDKINVRKRLAVSGASVLEWFFYQTDEMQEALPAVGDSVRLVPKIAKDLKGNEAHENNAWVRIEGKQALRLDAVKIVNIGSGNFEKFEGKSKNMKAIAVSTIKSLQDIQEEIGLPGFLVRYDMSELLLGDTTGLTPSDIAIEWENFVFTTLGSYVADGSGSVSCADEMFHGDCRMSKGYIYVAWNGLSDSGRMVGTGAYIYKYDLKITKKKKTMLSTNSTMTVGIRKIK